LMIGHMSDTHLGWYHTGERLVEREEDYYNAFREAVEVFIRERVDLVIHSGDILDTPRPYGTAVAVLIEGVRRLSENGIPFLFTLGEHDIPYIAGVTPYPMILERLGIGIYVGDGKPREAKGLRVVGLHKHKKYEHRLLQEKLEKIGEEQRTRGGKSVLVLHQGLREIAGPGAELSLAELPEGFHYYAMGHHHGYKVVDHGGGILSYPGPTHWVDVDESDECGVNIVDLSGDVPVVHRERLTSVRPKMRLRVTGRELRETIDRLIQKEHKVKPCLWLEVEEEGKLDLLSIEDKLKERYIVQEIRQVSPRVPEPSASDLAETTLEVKEKLRRLAMEVLGHERNTSFALDELLPLLTDPKRKGEAAEAVWRYYLSGEWK